MLYGTALYCSQKMVPQNRSFRFPVKILDISYRYRFLQCFSLSVYTVKKTVAIFFRFAIIISSYFITGRHSTSVVYQLPKLRRRVRFPLSAYSKKPSEIKNVLILLGFHMFKIFLFRKKFTSKSILFTSKYSTMYSTKCYPSFASSTYY